MKLIVSEIFKSIQGEGPKTGSPSVFLRLAGCNLRCKFCDTKYASFTEFASEWKSLELTDILREIEGIRGSAWNLVITGGEPLLQKQPLAKLIGTLESLFHTVEIETNGTILPEGIPLLTSLSFNVSIKLSNSGVDEDARINGDVINFYAEFERAYFKFVIGDEFDIQELLRIVENNYISPHRVYLMPMARDLEELDRIAYKVCELAIRFGFNYSDRLHIRLFGGQRGK
ncbi:MAG: 7-carboxy-7-deazaguanine synthase QueE [candidate division WOR-3 bacterium]